MFSRFLSINPPQPELLIDISREHKANSDYPDGYPSLHDFSHNNCFATYQQGNLKSPEFYYNPWRILRTELGAEYQELKTGVFHITKLPAKPQFNLADISCDIANFKGFGSKIGIFISSDKPFVDSDIKPRVIIMDGANGTNYQGAQKLNAGMNIWDLTNEPVDINPEESGRGAYVSFPNSWWDVEEDGTPVITPCDIYLVFFPVLDESNCNGYGEYLVPKFEAGIKDVGWNLPNYEVKVVDDTHLVCEQQMLTVSDAAYNPEVYYRDESLIVISPFVVNLKSSQPYRYIVQYSYSISGKYQDIVEQDYLGDGSPFVSYGVAFVPLEGSKFNESTTLVNYFAPLNLLLPGDTIQLLPYNYDRFTVVYSGNNTNLATIQVNETTPFHDKCELQTLIVKYRDTRKGNSIIYRNEVLSTNKDKLGIYGFRLNTASETVTQYSHRYCIIDNAQDRWKNLVSYCNNTIVTNQITDYELLYKDTVSAVVLLNNEEITDEDCSDSGAALFSSVDRHNYFSGQLYYLIGFKDRLTPWQIAYQIKQMN